jgi:sugar lactone lactonase YvrE
MIHCLLSFAAVAGIFFTDIAASQAIATVATGLGRPFGVAIHGNAAYVPDALTHKVWKVDLTPGTAYGMKTAVAGTGGQGYNGDGITPTLAQLDNPSGVAVDASGALYIADTGNHVVRKIAAPGVPGAIITTVAGIPTSYAVGESTLAGCGTPGFVGQCVPATGLRLFGPRAVAVDSAGNLYIADRMNQQIKKLYTSGLLSGLIFVVAGVAGVPGSNNGGTANCTDCSPAKFNSPVGVAVDAAFNVYVADEGNNAIRMISNGFVSTPTANILFSRAAAVVRPTGVVALGVPNSQGRPSLYIADYGHNRIQRYSCSVDGCGLQSVAGNGVPGFSGDGGAATSANLNSPIGVALDGQMLYIADLLNGRIRKVDFTPTVIQ